MGQRIKVGVIGAGRMGERHCRAYAALHGAELVGISDLALERGQAIASKYGATFYPDFRAMLPHVDAVTIATRTEMHFPVAMECLDQGVHVLIEKPLASGGDEAAQLVERAERVSRVLQVGHIERFNPAFLELESVIEDFEIVAVGARRLSPFDTSNTEVDVVFDLMIHDLDLTLALLGEGVDRVQAHGRSGRTCATDYAVATLSMAAGPMATLTASRVTEQKVRSLEVTALGAYIEADLLNKSICIYRRTVPEYIENHHRPLRYRQENVVERIYIPTAEPLMLELEDFVRCVREGATPRVTGRHGLRALDLAGRVRDQIVPSAVEGGALAAAS
jgi:virulence factor